MIMNTYKIIFIFLFVMLIPSHVVGKNRFIFENDGVNDFKCHVVKADDKIDIIIEGVVKEYGKSINVKYPFAPSLMVSFDGATVSKNEMVFDSYTFSLGHLFNATEEGLDDFEQKIPFADIINNAGRLMFFNKTDIMLEDLTENDFFGDIEKDDLNLTVAKTETTKFMFDQKLESVYLLLLLTTEPKKCFTKIEKRPDCEK